VVLRDPGVINFRGEPDKRWVLQVSHPSAREGIKNGEAFGEIERGDEEEVA
jgi:hypothetical protein